MFQVICKISKYYDNHITSRDRNQYGRFLPCSFYWFFALFIDQKFKYHLKYNAGGVNYSQHLKHIYNSARFYPFGLTVDFLN